jgi:hypothetical protein
MATIEKRVRNGKTTYRVRYRDPAGGQQDSPTTPRGAGCRARSVTMTTIRKAYASMANVTYRYQDLQRRTWCSSRPHSPLPACSASSTRQRVPATITRATSGRPAGPAQR